MNFEELGLLPEILQGIKNLGYISPMPIQEQVIPAMLYETSDLVGLAQTGTGKTAAYGLPILNLIDTKLHNIQALILSPTRELCVQIANDIQHFAEFMHDVKVVAVYGGENIVTQFKALDVQPHILVATPGRLIDLIERGKVFLNNVNYLVLDEADEMLNMGFIEEIEKILQSVPKTRRTLLFSATMPTEIANIAKNYMHDYHEIIVGKRNSGAENVEHYYYMVQAKNRYLALKRIVDINPDIYGIIFCRTRQETKEVAEKLMQDGYNADSLHGDLSQAQRDLVMNKFRKHNIQLLVATDVAARGLDVTDLTHIINYNLPDENEIYIHRSGRTGRANKSGISISIIHTRETHKIKELEKITKKIFTRLNIPSGLEICKKQLYFLIDKIENVQVNEKQIKQFLPYILNKLEYLNKEEIIRNFVSLEFNRFLNYYKDAEDINVYNTSKKNDKNKQNDNKSSKLSSSYGQKIRMKINIGNPNKLTPKNILGIINRISNDRSISITNIEITDKYSFFDVYVDQVDKLLYSFQYNNPTGFYIKIVDEDKYQNYLKSNKKSSNDNKKHKNSKPKNKPSKKR